MAFLQSFMLWGALAISVPLAIHLIQRRKSRPLAFPAIDFILRSRKAVAKRFRLKQILLLALRCALVGAVAVAAARPLFPGRDAAIGPSGGPAAVAIAIDSSLSMRARAGNGTAFDAAKSAALALVNSLGPDVEGVIVPFAADARSIPSAPTADKAQLTAAINALKPTFERTDVSRAFETAMQTLAASEKPRKLVYVLTDASAPGWEQIPARDPESKIGWRVIDVTERARANGAAAALQVVEEGAGATARVDVLSFGEASGVAPAPFQTSVELFINDSPAGRNFIEGQSGTTASTTFTLGAPTAGLNVAVARIGADALAEDDTRHAVFRGRGRLRTLLVDGDPRTTMRDAETFYLERALAPGRAGASALAPVVVDSEGLVRANLSQYDVVVLANVLNLPSPTITALKRWVQNGGGLLVSMGDRVEADIANLELGELLAMRLRGPRTAVPTGSEGGAAAVPGAGEPRELTLGPVPGRHPVTDTLDTTSEDVLGGTRFRTTELLEGGVESNTILKFSDGSPALVEKPLGRGKVALFASSLDRDWNDLPIATVYLPLMRRLIHYLAGDLGEDEAVDVLVGQPVSIETGDLKNVRVDGPEGFTAQVIPAIDGAVEITPPLPGVYRFSRDDGTPDERLIAKSFAANVDIAESDLRKVSAAELTRIFPEGVDFVPSGGLESSGSGSGAKSVPDQPMWGMLLGLALLALALEGVITGL